jgi:hypothetical protein
MNSGRLEAFRDVIAIIITIMVLEFKLPRGEAFDDLVPMCEHIDCALRQRRRIYSAIRRGGRCAAESAN